VVDLICQKQILPKKEGSSINFINYFSAQILAWFSRRTLDSQEWEDNWTFFGDEHDGLPAYVVFEYYCDKAQCDCQNLIAVIMRLRKDGEPIAKTLALIDYDS
jgi:hypothetical protein